MISQDFYRSDSDYPKDKCSQSFVDQVPQKLYTCGFVYESVGCALSVYLCLISAGSGAEATEGCCLLACSPWLAQSAFF